ncbi:hypothetical protein [Anaerosporobacter faecicola]|nr:hypothetical protein [Anaerosporobacter faecicola]
MLSRRNVLQEWKKEKWAGYLAEMAGEEYNMCRIGTTTIWISYSSQMCMY